MDRQILTQEEINALLKGDEGDSSQLTPMQTDALGEIGNISYGTASTALSELLNKRVIIDTPTVILSTQKALKEQHPVPYVLVEVDYKKGLTGSNVLILKVSDALVIADLMMGKDGSNPKQTLEQLELSAVGESMNQMVGNAATSLSTLFRQRIDVDPPRIKVVDLASDSESIIRDVDLDNQIVVVSFKLQIDGLVDSELMLVISYDLAIELADKLIEETQVATTLVTESVAPVVEEVPARVNSVETPEFQQPIPPQPSQPVMEPVTNTQPVNTAPTPAPVNYSYNRTEVRSPVMVQPAQFGPIGNGKTGKETGNIGLILDVPLQVTVELGGTRMKIKDILDLGIGSIIELDKLAGDPVDVYVNGKMIAKGEVVVIDENFGIKITDIISPLERANTLQ
ncbi:MAG: flagellar motor switch phosphatase FliY [Firmicutes bacterium]|nr:flagellar motor switch phosphatase FliY [Bacillota bacterium]